MRIKIEYSAQLKKSVGAASEELEAADGATVNEVIRQIAGREGGEVASFLLGEDGVLNASILLCVNDEQVFWSDERVLAEGDVVSLTTPIAGGAV